MLTRNFVFDDVVERRFPVCEIHTGCGVSPINRDQVDDVNLHHISRVIYVHFEWIQSVEIEIFVEFWGFYIVF